MLHCCGTLKCLLCANTSKAIGIRQGSIQHNKACAFKRWQDDCTCILTFRTGSNSSLSPPAHVVSALQLQRQCARRRYQMQRRTVKCYTASTALLQASSAGLRREPAALAADGVRCRDWAHGDSLAQRLDAAEVFGADGRAEDLVGQ
jgi:hypothetical protein